MAKTYFGYKGVLKPKPNPDFDLKDGDFRYIIKGCPGEMVRKGDRFDIVHKGEVIEAITLSAGSYNNIGEFKTWARRVFKEFWES